MYMEKHVLAKYIFTNGLIKGFTNITLVKNTVYRMEIYFFSGKKISRVHSSVNKMMLIVFLDLKKPIAIDIQPVVNIVFNSANLEAKFTLLIELPSYNALLTFHIEIIHFGK